MKSLIHWVWIAVLGIPGLAWGGLDVAMIGNTADSSRAAVDREAIIAPLTAAGHTVDAFDSVSIQTGEVAAAELANYDVMVISESVLANELLPIKEAGFPIPMVLMEKNYVRESGGFFLVPGAQGENYHVRHTANNPLASVTREVTIINADHPLLQDFEEGQVVQMHSGSDDRMGWMIPQDESWTVLAHFEGDPTRGLIVAIPEGSTTVDGVVLPRTVTYLIHRTLYPDLSAEAHQLLVQSVEWAADFNTRVPTPADEAMNVMRDTVLSWTVKEPDSSYDVYFGALASDVNNAGPSDPLGVLVASGQDVNTFDPGLLDYGTTYYWRVDEVLADGSEIFKGRLWSFTTEALANPIVPVAVTASSAHTADMAPDKTIDGSGLNADDQHSTVGTDMWLTGATDTERSIQYTFDKLQKLHRMWVWNSNQSIEALIGFGAKDVTVETSLDGETWTALTDVPEFARASGTPDYTNNTVVDFGGVSALHVRLTINSVWGMPMQSGLSEVRFFAVPVYAWQPEPAVGSSDLPTALELGWRAGREAARHEVYLGTDPNALVRVGEVTDTHYTVSVDLDRNYFWRIDEVNDMEDPTVWSGDTWSFSTAMYTVIDDMESYRDAEFQEIWATWTDGYNDPANGAIVGNGSTGAPESDIVYNGRQSLPLSYGQEGANLSETTRSFSPVMDWSKNGVQALSLMFHGATSNSSGQLYLGINGTRVVDYPGAADDLKRAQWHTWSIDLGALGVTQVNSLIIGVQGGNGKIYIDTLRLYGAAREAMVPVQADDAGLVAYYPLNGNTQDLSDKGRHGSAVGDPFYVTGPAGLGSGLDFDGAGGQYVDLGTWDPIVATGQLTLSLWAQWSGPSTQFQGLIGKRDNWSETEMRWQLEAHRDTGIVSFGRNGSVINTGLALVDHGEWECWAVTTDGARATVYRHGLAVAIDDFTFGTKADASMQIGASQMGGGNPFNGALSEVRLYDRILSPAEIAGLAGRTAPFYHPE